MLRVFSENFLKMFIMLDNGFSFIGVKSATQTTQNISGQQSYSISDFARTSATQDLYLYDAKSSSLVPLWHRKKCYKINEETMSTVSRRLSNGTNIASCNEIRQSTVVNQEGELRYNPANWYEFVDFDKLFTVNDNTNFFEKTEMNQLGGEIKYTVLDLMETGNLESIISLSCKKNDFTEDNAQKIVTTIALEMYAQFIKFIDYIK